MAFLAEAMVLVTIILDVLVRRPAMAVEVPALLLIICAGTFGALTLSGSMLLGQFTVVLGAAVLGSLVFTARKVNLGRGIVPVFSLLLVTLLLSGYFFAELPATSAALIAFAPVLALIPIRRLALPAFLVRRPWCPFQLVALVLAFVLLAVELLTGIGDEERVTNERDGERLGGELEGGDRIGLSNCVR